MSSVGKKIKALRKSQGLTQNDLADQCGWEFQSRVGNYERGLREPSIDDLSKIANALRCSVADLVSGDSIKGNESEAYRQHFSKRLSSAIEHAGWKLYGSGQRLAEITLVTPKAANKWLNGEAMPGHSNMVQVAQALGVRAEWLEYGIGQMTEEAAASSENQTSSDSQPTRSKEKRAEILDEHFSILQVETRDSNSTKFLLSRHTGEEFKVILDHDDMQEDEHRKIWAAARNRELIRLEVNAVFVDDTILTAHLISIL